MSDLFDTYELSFLKNIKVVQRTLQDTNISSAKFNEMNESIKDATQDVLFYQYS